MSNVDSMTDEQWAELHQQVGCALRSNLQEIADRMREVEEELAFLKQAARETRESIEAGRWWELEGTLTKDQIELLCECEPNPPISILEEAE